MQNYTQGESKEVTKPSPFSDHINLITMRVNHGSKIRNLMGFALAKIRKDEIRELCWYGCGEAISKTITCAEIMKKKQKKLYQLTKLRYKIIEEYWEPKVDGLERLRVNKNIPEVYILLSKDALDSAEPGYQAPGNLAAFWNDITSKKKSNNSSTKQRPGNSNRDNEQSGANSLARKKKKKPHDIKSAEKAVKRAKYLGEETQKLQKLSKDNG